VCEGDGVLDVLAEGEREGDTLAEGDTEGDTLGVTEVDGVADDETGTGAATLEMFCCTSAAETLVSAAYANMLGDPSALELLRRASAVLTAPLAGTMICEPKVLLPASSVSKRRRRTSMCSRAT
jgi:hypothetical protein